MNVIPYIHNLGVDCFVPIYGDIARYGIWLHILSMWFSCG